MLHGIDISNHQGDNGLNLDAILPYVDFVIVKATGGNYFVDAYCDGFVQKCIAACKPWGFYHFANDGIYSNPEDEACFFVENCRNYFGHGIPILDWEVDVDSWWVNTFVRAVHDMTGVWCWIYGNTWRFDSSVEQNCARWIASYPSWILYPGYDFDPGECPDCNGLVAAWQFASDGRIPGYDGNLDMNVYYGDEFSWMKYANPDAEIPQPEPEPEPEPTCNYKLIYTLEDEQYKVDIFQKI